MLALVVVVSVLAVRDASVAMAVPPVNATAPSAPVAFPLPEWAPDARWYEIEVPHFQNGDETNDLPGTSTWTAEGPSPMIASGEPAPFAPRRLFGGDLAGVLQRLPYLKRLGVNTLYLRSIFHGATDTPARPTDMRHIDDVIAVARAYPEITVDRMAIDQWTVTASDAMFVAFLKKAHRAGFRVVVRFDTGFRARRGNTRSYQDYTLTPYLREIAKKWTDPNGDGDPSDGVDGWVMTIASGERDGAAETFSRAVREINANALIVSRGRLGRDVTGVGFVKWSGALLESFVKLFLSPGRVPARIRAVFTRGVRNAIESGMMPSAGTPNGFSLERRAPTQCSADPDVHAVPDETAYARYRLALMVQYFLPGAPVTLFGSEVGMYGGEIDLTSAPMWWADAKTADAKPTHFQRDILALTTWLNEFRASHAALSRGAFLPILLDEKRLLFAFARATPTEEITLVVNYGDTAQQLTLAIAHAQQPVEVFTPRHTATSIDVGKQVRTAASDGSLRIDIPPMSAVVLRTHNNKPGP